MLNPPWRSAYSSSAALQFGRPGDGGSAAGGGKGVSVGVGVGGTRVAVTVGGGGANDGSIGVRSGGAVDTGRGEKLAASSGIVMPTGGGFRKKLVLRVEHFSSVLLLPFFFAFIGLRTQIGLLDSSWDWIICLVIIVVATVGKLGGTSLVSRIMKLPWRDSLQLGALMNTRGLMELIVLNIGYDLGILSLRIFTMLVLMAIITTLMTGPLLNLFDDKAVAATR